MKKPAILSIEDSEGNVVYMTFFDTDKTQIYIDALDELNESFEEVVDPDTKDSYYLASQPWGKGSL